MKSLIFVHQGVSGETEEAISRFGFSVIRLPSFYVLGPLVAGHPDSLLFPLPDGRLLLHAEYYAANRALFDGLGLRVAVTDEPAGAFYPRDILLNAFAFDGVLYGRLDSVSKIIASAFADRVNIRQGYARCSALALGDRAVATSDLGLADALERRGACVLRLPPGEIRLRAETPERKTTCYECEVTARRDRNAPETPECGAKIKPRGNSERCDGFIGGCGVMLDTSVCGFFGDVSAYAHYAALREFADARGAELLSLDKNPLTDFGGAVIVRA